MVVAGMKVLVIGGGGREHALVWKIAQSPRVAKIYCAPGNVGIAGMATCVDIKADDIEGLASFAQKANIDLTVVGPELPLTLGIVDLFRKKSLKIFGPTKKAAILEASKVFTKDFFVKHGIPTAVYEKFTDPKKAKEYVKKTLVPIVVKADGLAAGKGVIICRTEEEAVRAIDDILVKKIFGDAGREVVVEEFLKGVESSFMAIVAGETIVPLATSKDHKAIYDGDEGPNTGGMGAYSPSRYVSQDLEEEIVQKVIKPTALGMKKEGRDFTGVLYAGLMLTDMGVRVLEYNVRFGDPETQVVLVRLKSDIVDLLEAAVDGTLDRIKPEWDDGHAICVVMASGGYPGDYSKGYEISGLNGGFDDGQIFHSGTAEKDGKVVTNGGRVLGVTALGKNLIDAHYKAYECVKRINWKDVYFRKDIGV